MDLKCLFLLMTYVVELISSNNETAYGREKEEQLVRWCEDNTAWDFSFHINKCKFAAATSS